MWHTIIQDRLRSLSPRYVAVGSVTAHFAALLIVTLVWVLPAYMTWRNVTATRLLHREKSNAFSRINEELTKKRVELAGLYSANGGNSPGIDGEPSINQIFDNIQALANQSGASVSLFEQAVHSSELVDVHGFVRISFETNFLQLLSLVALIESRAELTRVERFSMSIEGDKFESILFSLVISGPASGRKLDSRCNL